MENYPLNDPKYPHAKDQVSKVHVATKIKAVRIKYRQAVDTQRRSGHGRAVSLFFELCDEIWGTTPASTTVEHGLETAEVNDDGAAEPGGVELAEESVQEDTSSSEPAGETLARRRHLLQAKLNSYKTTRLQKKVRSDEHHEDLQIKKRIADIMENAEREHSSRMDALVTAQIRMSQSFETLVRHFTSPSYRPNMAFPHNAPTYPQPMASSSSYLPPAMPSSYQYIPQEPPMPSCNPYLPQPPRAATYTHQLVSETTEEEDQVDLLSL
ncbi:uncharacterized protein PAE49_007004 [Odontesthes bonariensis]|uniref:uncharacterized protein LOC142382741 n=1 Tax=Odontesthes bonariensis TaxID=219752 RepID=UPI003F589DFB